MGSRPATLALTARGPDDGRMLSSFRLKPRMPHRILSGHPWVYASEVGRVDGEPADGDCVEVRDPKGRLLGSALYSGTSQIAARRYSRQSEDLNNAVLGRKLDAALAYRCRLDDEESAAGRPVPQARRLVWSDADELPGLIVDRYADVLVLQTLTAGMARRQEAIVGLLTDRLHPATILARNDVPVRRMEGLDQERCALTGSYQSPTRVEIAGLPLELDLLEGQKTGFYLDQAETYPAVARHAAGRRVLDCFTNQGGFALTCLRAGAASCRAVDQSAEALARGEACAKRLGVEATWEKDNVFDLLPKLERAGDVYDMVILDPPSFTRGKAQVASALRGYKELHLRALRLLPPGGLLATFCCSHHIGDREWAGLLADAAGDAGVTLRRWERYGQSRDHPVLATVPETEYLRGDLLEKLG